MSKIRYIGKENNFGKRIVNRIKRFSYGIDISFYEKIQENIFKNKRITHFKFEDRISEIRGKRWSKYALSYRKIIDYKYNYIPITHNISGIKEDMTNISEEDITPYCYNSKYYCPFWRNDYSNGIVYCDAYNFKNSEIDNSNEAYIKAMKKFKTFKELDKVNTCTALFDMVDICSFKWELFKMIKK